MAKTQAASSAIQADLSALMQCLLVMAGADKVLTLSEIEVVSEHYASESGREIDHNLVGEVFAALKSCDAGAALDALRKSAPGLDDETKEHIVKCSYRVMVADRKIDRREAERLSEIAAALGIAEARLPALMRSARI